MRVDHATPEQLAERDRLSAAVLESTNDQELKAVKTRSIE
jgi:hypothetical protein